MPDETTICEFRHLLERHDLVKKLFAEVNRDLADCGITISGGTIVDATIIHAPSSTKNRERQRDPDMHQTKKGNQWYFGMKAHIGADSRSKLVHSIVATAANVHDGARFSPTSCTGRRREYTETTPTLASATSSARNRHGREPSSLSVPIGTAR